MVRRLTVLLAWLFSAACGTMGVEEEIPAVTQEPTGYSFREADSLLLRGSFQSCRDSLLAMLDAGAPQNEVMLRLTGLYSGMALEDRLVILLDSLTAAGREGLEGWKVSVLTIGGMQLEAAGLVDPDSPLLRAALLFAIDSLPAGFEVSFPVDPTAGEVHSWISITDPETLDRYELAALLPFSCTVPGVSSAIQEGLVATSDTAGGWWWEVTDSLAAAGQVSAADAAVLTRFASMDGGDETWWLDRLDEEGPAVATAAVELAERFPEAVRCNRAVEDILASCGRPDLTRLLTSGGGPEHLAGAEMAALLAEERYQDLERLCGSVGSDASDTLRARAAMFLAAGLRSSGAGGSRWAPAAVAFAGEFPWHPEVRRMAYDAGKYYDCEQEWASAGEAYLLSLRSAGGWEGDERGTWRGGFSLYMSGDRTRADSLWAAGAVIWPYGYWRDEMLFWRARLAGESGDVSLRESLTALLIRDHPWEFYGMLAARRNGTGDAPGMPVNGFLPASSPACSVAVVLLAGGYAQAGLDMLASGPLETLPERAAALSLLGRHGSALTLLRVMDQSLRDSGTGMLPDSLLCYYFPAPYRDLAGAATRSLGLSSGMLQGIMREESYFDRTVVSSAGAVGVVQLMPSTASDVARWYGLPVLEEDEFFDPAASVPYGAIYIDRQRSAYGGAEALFLAAYNAGPGNSDRWVGMHGWNPEDPELYIEQITYRETRIYVKKVLRSSWIYEGWST